MGQQSNANSTHTLFKQYIWEVVMVLKETAFEEVVIVLQGSLGTTRRGGKIGGNLASCHGPSMVN